MKTKYDAKPQKEEKYVDYDDEFFCWAIFGLESGFCYGQYSSKESAEESLKN